MNINFPAVGVSVLCAMVVGFLWYGPLFGKAWAKEMNFDMSQKPPNSEMIRGTLLMLVGSFFLAFCLAHTVEAWRIVMSMVPMGQQAPMEPAKIPMVLALNSAGWTTIGYIMPVILNQVAYEKRSWKLFFINTGYYLASLLGMSFIMAYWVK